MSHSYGDGNFPGTSFLGKKRLEDDNQIESRYHYDKYDKYDKYSNNQRYSNNSYMHSKFPLGNSYYNYNSNYRYRNNYYNNSKNFYSNNYINKKYEYKKPYQKFNSANVNEGIRNLSNCEMPSPTSSSQKKINNMEICNKNDSSSTMAESNASKNSGLNNGINIKELNKLVNNINSRIPQSKNQHYKQQIFQNNQQNINIEIHLSPPSNLKFNKEKQLISQKNDHTIPEKNWKKDEKKEDEFPPMKIPKPSQKQNIEPFNRKSIKIEENPLDSFNTYPKNPYDINLIFQKQNINTSINESINNDNIENALSIKSSYLLAKIPNWRLVTNFVPVSSLTEEKFENIISLNEEELIKEKKNKKKEKNYKTYIVYSEKFDECVEKCIEQNKITKKKINMDIFNIKSIIEQYHYDILKIQNRIKQNDYHTNFLSCKLESLANAIEENSKE